MSSCAKSGNSDLRLLLNRRDLHFLHRNALYLTGIAISNEGIALCEIPGVEDVYGTKAHRECWPAKIADRDRVRGRIRALLVGRQF